MKATIGAVQVTGSPAEMALLILALNGKAAAEPPPAPAEPQAVPWEPPQPSAEEFQRKINLLTALQRKTFNEIERHADGVHYTVVAQTLGDTPGKVSGRMQELLRKRLVVRVAHGAYRSARPSDVADSGEGRG